MDQGTNMNSLTRMLCGSLILPTVATIAGKLMFGRIQSNFQRSLLVTTTFSLIVKLFTLSIGLLHKNISLRYSPAYIFANPSILQISTYYDRIHVSHQLPLIPLLPQFPPSHTGFHSSHLLSIPHQTTRAVLRWSRSRGR